MSALTTITAADYADTERATVRHLDEICAALEALDAAERHPYLVSFFRAPIYNSALMFVEGRVGAIAKQAYLAFKADWNKATPAKAWADADARLGRESIARLLGVAGQNFYATLPFRTMTWNDDRPVIGAAIGCPRMFREQPDLYDRLDITDVILWDPRSNDVALAGEHPSSTRLLLPSEATMADRLVVYADPGAFFRAWAAKRLAIIIEYQKTGRSFETDDGCIPGAFLVGKPAAVTWSHVHCPTIVAGPGVDRRELHRAIVASARLPKVEGDHGDRG
jgi:hypothetical protein